MANKKESNFRPNIAISPGESIRDSMKALGMDQEELAGRLGITTKHLSQLINGKVNLTHEMAIRLEDVVGASAKFWMNLETNYQLNKLRLDNDSITLEELDILPKIPYKEMMTQGWIEKIIVRGDNAKRSLVYSLRQFFAVASLTKIQESYCTSFRKQKLVGEVSDFGTLAWIRQAEICGQRRHTEEFDKNLLLSLLPRLREQTVNDPNVFYPILVDTCASCGVALVLVEHIKNTGICGATLWRGDKAVLALSLRGKKDDIFWFTFFHEIAHLIKHDKRARIKFDNKNNLEEQEADDIASSILISNELYETFLRHHDCNNRDDIVSYSSKIGVASSILLGRLQHDDYVDYSRFNELKKTFVMSN